MLAKIAEHRELVDPTVFVQNVRWAPSPSARTAAEAEPAR